MTPLGRPRGRVRAWFVLTALFAFSPSSSSIVVCCQLQVPPCVAVDGEPSEELALETAV